MSQEQKIQVGVIGGSGLYQLDGIENLTQIQVDTPFGKPSDDIFVGTLSGINVGFLPRHARGHRFTPSEVPYQANIAAMKLLGASTLISVSAVGSLKEEIEPGHAVIIDQLFDRTKGIRKDTYFGNGIVGHVSAATPLSALLREDLIRVARKHFPKVHDVGTYIAIEGPRFSTRAESNFFRQLGGAVIGMTAYPEAILAKEAGLHYATLALATDYDCWKIEVEPVSVEAVMKTMHQNVQSSIKTLSELIPIVGSKTWPLLPDRGETGIMTAKDAQPEAQINKLRGLVLS